MKSELPAQPQSRENNIADKHHDPKKKKGKWWKYPLGFFGVLILLVLLIPVLLYIPPIQTAVKDLACRFVENSTGMKIGIDRFRLKFPLDLQLDGVTVIPAPGDTMVAARSLVADIRLMPLLHLDVDIQKLQLQQARLNILSADSSMDMKIRAGLLELAPGSAVDIKSGNIDLRDALIKDGAVSLTMDVWKKQPAPNDTTQTPFIIKANSLRLENFAFDMAMLPTIDTLSFRTKALDITDATIDLLNSNIKVASLSAGNGDFKYITPTPEYIAAHPAPVDSTSSPSAPMVIAADSLALNNFSLLYATAGAKPQPGFDPSYISLSDLNVGLRNFYNAATDISAPVTRLSGNERSGLSITSGSGIFSMDSIGMNLRDLKIATPYSTLDVSAAIPNSLMALDPKAKVDVKANISVGMKDVTAFLPSLAKYTDPIRVPLNARLDAGGTLGDVVIPTLDIALPGTLSLRASGTAANALDFNKMVASLKFNGSLTRPSLIEKILGSAGVPIPSLSINGTATANHRAFGADFTAETEAGDIAALGHLNLNSEAYTADISIRDLEVDYFMKDLGISFLTADFKANGAGVNPEKKSARTDIQADIREIIYNKVPLRNIHADVTLDNGELGLNLISPNRNLDMTLSGTGSIAEDLYDFDITADIHNADLMALGLSPTPNYGTGSFTITGTASPRRWNYDVDLDLNSLCWTIDKAVYKLPPLIARFHADDLKTWARVNSEGLNVDFNTPNPLKPFIDNITAATTGLADQLKAKNIDVEDLEQKLPEFNLVANASGRGIVAELLSPSDMAVDTLYATIAKDSLIHANIGMFNVSSGKVTVDTVTFALKQRSNLLDYMLHVGNGPGQMEEFANVNISGYLANNRLSTYLVQNNIKGEQGYRLGFSAAMNDSIATLHFTPLKATIAYHPWTINLDNFVDYRFSDNHIEANLQASSNESSILLRTEPLAQGDGEQLHLNLKDIHVQDFLNMSVTAPPITATVNSDLIVVYTGHSFEGAGEMKVTGASYARQPISDLDLALKAGIENELDSKVEATLKVADQDALTASMIIARDSAGAMTPTQASLRLDGFPLNLANPFLGPDVAALSGKLRGECDLSSSKENGILLNGQLKMDSVGVFIPMMGTNLSLDSAPILVDNNVITFDQYDIYAVNKNPLTINGTVDATKFSDIKLNLLANASDFQLVGNKNTKNDISGKLFLNLDARAKGSLSVMDINASATILSATDLTYNINPTAALSADNSDGNVKFVNLSDTTQVEKADSITTPAMAMRISASLTLQQGMEATVNLPSMSGTSGKVQVSPAGTLSYFQNYMGDMKLTGTLTTGEGYVKYAIPVIGTKNFQFEPSSSIVWNGDLMNPTLKIKAADPVKANVSTNGVASLVDFDVILNVTGNLSAPKVLFDLSTDNDMTIQNELQGMSTDQRSTTAMNLLLTGQYTGSGAKSVSSNMVTGNLYNMLTSQLNSLAARAIKGVDLSFGVNQYETGDVNSASTTTSYSYQVSKSLFNNRFKIVVGGNYTTDANADENFAQNLLSDVSFDYTFLRGSNYSLIGKLFRHTGYESILEGEVTETGLGLAYKRRLSTLRSLFRFRRKKKNPAAEIPVDSLTAVPLSSTLNDSSLNSKEHSDK